MKVEEMRTKSPQNLSKHAEKLEKKLAEARTALHLNEVKDVKSLRTVKKELAQTLTILKENERMPAKESKEKA